MSKTGNRRAKLMNNWDSGQSYLGQIFHVRLLETGLRLLSAFVKFLNAIEFSKRSAPYTVYPISKKILGKYCHEGRIRHITFGAIATLKHCMKVLSM